LGKVADPSTTLSPERATTPSGRGGFHALTPTLRQVACPDKFKPRPIDKYDGSNSPEEFIQVYHTIIDATGGENREKANYLLMTLSDAARSWLTNLLEGTIYNWDQLSWLIKLSRACMSVCLQQKPCKPSSRSMMKASKTT
jgi:hypothetical protein